MTRISRRRNDLQVTGQGGKVTWSVWAAFWPNAVPVSLEAGGAYRVGRTRRPHFLFLTLAVFSLVFPCLTPWLGLQSVHTFDRSLAQLRYLNTNSRLTVCCRVIIASDAEAGSGSIGWETIGRNYPTDHSTARRIACRRQMKAALHHTRSKMQ